MATTETSLVITGLVLIEGMSYCRWARRAVRVYAMPDTAFPELPADEKLQDTRILTEYDDPHLHLRKEGHAVIAESHNLISDRVIGVSISAFGIVIAGLIGLSALHDSDLQSAIVAGVVGLFFLLPAVAALQPESIVTAFDLHKRQMLQETVTGYRRRKKHRTIPFSDVEGVCAQLQDGGEGSDFWDVRLRLNGGEMLKLSTSSVSHSKKAARYISNLTTLEMLGKFDKKGKLMPLDKPSWFRRLFKLG